MAVTCDRVAIFIPKNLCGLIVRTALERQPRECVRLYGSWNHTVALACVTSYSVGSLQKLSGERTRSSDILAKDYDPKRALIGVVRSDDDNDDALSEPLPQLSRETYVFSIRSAKLVARAPAHPLYVISYEANDFLSPFCDAEDLGCEAAELAFVASVCRATNRLEQEACVSAVSAFTRSIVHKICFEVFFSVTPAGMLCGKALSFQTSGGILRRLCNSQFCPAIVDSLASKCQLAHEPVVPVHKSEPSFQRLLGLRKKTVACQLWADMILGIVCMVLLHKNREIIAQTMAGMTEVVVGGLYQLLEWMMGAPAGLKLNRQLDVFLGKFFSYHVWLWAGYLDYQSKHMHSLINFLAAAGILGMSTQIAIARDLFALSTMHLYCFYLYMARLYYVQVAALKSFWRLFRGKKWNSLRLRVDTAEYDVQQLFVGTLLLAVVLFLLPTVALYYAVFAALRVAVCCIQSALRLVGDVLGSCYWYLALLKLSKSSSLVGSAADYKLCPDHSNEHSHVLYLQMKLKQVPYFTLCQSLQLKQLPLVIPSWPSLVARIVLGHLV